ncbi:carotenoid ester lipase [Coprinopsis cinerea AmutBmut pab1-1]|nr:carotenoid ester lipase [Coprinopsis cinerea AmutBmut pab1-1]
MEVGKLVIVVTFNYRIGLLGFAASPMLQEDNKLSGDEGTGNYGLRDQQRCLEWLHRHIGEFGGDPTNITLFGASSGAADIICHLLSKANETKPSFARAIVQSAVFEPTVPDVNSAGWQLSRLMSSLQVTDMESLRALKVEKLCGLGQCLRAVDDGVFFRDGWKSYFSHSHSHDDGERRSHRSTNKKQTPHIPKESFLRAVSPTRLSPNLLTVPSRSRSRSRTRSLTRRDRSRSRTPVRELVQPLIIGDCSTDSLLWSLPISLWTSAAVVRRLKAICLSLAKANTIARAYDISSYTPEEEIAERVLDLVNDARVAWPTECIFQNAKRERGGRGVWRYVFDQEGPARGIPHHAADIMYLFDTVPLPESVLASAQEDTFFDGPFDVSDDEDDLHSPIDFNDADWETTPVDEFSYTRVRDAMQERWIAFAHGEAPWREDRVFVFGPEGETGERSASIFEGRRRKHVWKEALEPLGHALVQKIGVELSRGPCGSQ